MVEGDDLQSLDSELLVKTTSFTFIISVCNVNSVRISPIKLPFNSHVSVNHQESSGQAGDAVLVDGGQGEHGGADSEGAVKLG